MHRSQQPPVVSAIIAEKKLHCISGLTLSHSEAHIRIYVEDRRHTKAFRSRPAAQKPDGAEVDLARFLGLDDKTHRILSLQHAPRPQLSFDVQ